MSSTIIRSEISEKGKIYKEVMIRDSIIRDSALIADYAVIYSSIIGEHVEIDRNCYIQDSVIGFGSYIRKNSLVKFSNIGKFNSISWDVSIGGSNHDYRKASTYTPYWWKRVFGVDSTEDEIDKSMTSIGNDVWISAGVNIIRGVTIGNGAVIGAGAVITKDVEPFSIVVGMPGKTIKKRFDEKSIEILEKIKWWDWPFEVIKDNAHLFKQEMSIKVLKELENVYNHL